MYEYRCKVTRVIDGDTLAVSVDLGCDVTVTMTVRLYGVNCPEMHGDTRIRGGMAKAYVVDWLNVNDPDGHGFLLVTHKDKREKYGRYLGDVYANGLHLNEDLVADGHAVRYLP